MYDICMFRLEKTTPTCYSDCLNALARISFCVWWLTPGQWPYCSIAQSCYIQAQKKPRWQELAQGGTVWWGQRSAFQSSYLLWPHDPHTSQYVISQYFIVNGRSLKFFLLFPFKSTWQCVFMYLYVFYNLWIESSYLCFTHCVFIEMVILKMIWYKIWKSQKCLSVRRWTFCTQRSCFVFLPKGAQLMKKSLSFMKFKLPLSKIMNIHFKN